MESFLVIGIGRFGRSLATELYSLGHEVMIIDDDEENVSDIIDQVTHGIIGDAKEESVLKSLGVSNFDCVIVTIGAKIEDSIIVTLMLKEMGAKKIVCKAQNHLHEKALTLIGADKVVKPEYDMGKQVAFSLVKRNIIDHMNISEDYQVVEINTPTKWANRSILESNIRKKHHITILAIRKKGSKNVDISFSPTVVLDEGDTLVVIGLNEDIDRLSNYFIEE